MSNEQQLEPSLERQLADYFSWLEQHLVTTMSPTVAASGRAPRRRRVALAAAAVLAVAGVGAAYVTSPDSSPSVSSAAPTSSADVSSTIAGTSAEATIWAPMKLPDSMEVVGIYNGVRLDEVSATTQYFGRFDGSSLATQLVVVVTEGSNYLITDTEVHGLRATMLHPSATSVSVEWTEGDAHIIATAAGFSDEEMLALLNATTPRTDPLQGIEPQSVGGGMTELLSHLRESPADWSAFVIYDSDSDTYVWVEPGLNLEPNLLEPNVVQVEGFGQLFHDMHGSTVFVTTDGTQIALGNWMVDVRPSESQQVAIAQAFALTGPDQIQNLRRDVGARLLDLPSVEEVPIGGHTLVLRGGSRDLPEAVCLRDASSEACHFNAINRPGGVPEFDQMSTTKVALSGEWFIIGYNQGALPLDDVFVPRSMCIAEAAGAVTEVLPDTRVDVDGREYFTAAVPATVDYVRSCYLDDGTLVPASSGMLIRPVE